ncbi:heavy metal sensor signal transduction histidine kinase [Hyphomicrobium denitrificans 1NES1]|uniref:Sensor protein n=2 Tax=Hyphomicrobium denitrificans TaxID=53399 RepID=N0B7Y9_9HYPH|nr:heavy metal sensor signal transduction histidine kinase [Hyphomicrobium denitrificans 1NES1]
MTTWYALSTFMLIFAATGFLYWVLATNLQKEDDGALQDNLNNAQLMLRSSASGLPSGRHEVEPVWSSERRPEIYIRLLDGNARTIVETPGMPEELPPPTAADLASLGSQRTVNHEAVSRSGKLLQTVTARAGGEGVPARYLQIAMDRHNDEDLLAHYREQIWIVLSVSVILCSLVGYAIARSGMRPIESISGTAERIRSATLHERIETPELPAELAGLAKTFNTMLDRLQDSFARISQFSDDVAHELRTPIHNLRGEIEVALSKSRSSEDYRDTLGSCLEECGRISRVIQSLLFLARADKTPEVLRLERIDIREELTRVQEFYEAAASDAGLDLTISAPSDLCAPLDRSLFQQAVGNLVSNAIAHTPAGGMIRVVACEDGPMLKMSVIDSGCGIAPEHLPYVLDRFYRVDRARTGSRQNVGLGLAVVKSIVEWHGGCVVLDSKPGEGTCVSLRFPSIAEKSAVLSG